MTSRPGQPPSPPPPPPPANTRNRRSLRQYSGYCSVYAYTPNIVGVGGDQYHMHAQSEQYCTTAASTGSVITYLERDSTYMAGDSDTNFGGQVENTDAWTTCHYAGVHTWWNYSDFTAQVNGQLVQGPAGFFTYADHRCY